MDRFDGLLPVLPAEQYLSTTFRPLLAVHSSHGLYSRALQLARERSLSWYDSLIVASAIEERCGVIYSEDLQHGQRLGGLRVDNPFLYAIRNSYASLSLVSNKCLTSPIHLK